MMGDHADAGSAGLKLKVNRTTTKKWVPTQHGGNGHVSGVESLNKKNLEKHGDWGTFRFTPHMWPFLPAIAAFKTVKAVSDFRATLCETTEKVLPNRNPTAMLMPSPLDAPVIYENNNKSSLKGIKADRLDLQHMQQSTCASDREQWQRCVKDRFNKRIDCNPLLEKFRQCQEGPDFA
jgi:hypothetical protein